MIRIPYAPPDGYLDEPASEESDLEETAVKNNSTSVEEMIEDMKRKENNAPSQNGGNTSHHFQEYKYGWFSSNFSKLEAFKEKLPPSQRKAEWRRFREQFQRIMDGKNSVDPETKLKILKIHAGEYLLNIIEMQEAILVLPVEDMYTEVISLVNNYFESTCNKTQERIKFRKMQQKTDESFTDWILRLESQSKFCDFNEEQRKEEFLQALIGNSASELAEKLYEASSYFSNDINKLIQHGQHLDIMRIHKSEAVSNPVMESEVPHSELTPRPVMWVGKGDGFKERGRNNRYEPYQRTNRSQFSSGKECDRCGRFHAVNRCPAYRSKCGKCGKIGHWVARCLQGNDFERDKKNVLFKHVSRINKVDNSDSN